MSVENANLKQVSGFHEKTEVEMDCSKYFHFLLRFGEWAVPVRISYAAHTYFIYIRPLLKLFLLIHIPEYLLGGTFFLQEFTSF